ncbi:hypothetical protein HYQ46_001432 [Verticillium longisporum]|nr:hypothetical protein HYQ46_001432 [Verticillium longisporum]
MQISEQPRHARTQAKVELMTLVSGEGVRPFQRGCLKLMRLFGEDDGKPWGPVDKKGGQGKGSRLSCFANNADIPSTQQFANTRPAKPNAFPRHEL